MGKKIVVLTSIATLVILIGGVFFLSKSSSYDVVTSENVKAEAKVTAADWGRIPMYKGNVSKTFTIKSSGIDALRLFNVRTSCHCTKAIVIIDGKESPAFGMSSVSSWMGEVVPGKEAKLTVVFDPAYHGPNGIGLIERYVSIETNDKSNQKLTFSVKGEVYK